MTDLASTCRLSRSLRSCSAPTRTTQLLGAGLIFATLGVGVTSAHASSCSISATGDGSQQVPPVVSTGTGTVSGAFNTGSSLFSWSGSYQNLANVTMQHFHVGAVG